MAKRRWDRKRRRMAVRKPRIADRRTEKVEVYRDPESRLLLKVGPDHGTEERARHDGGVVIGEKVLGLRQTAWAVAPGALELLRHEGGLAVGLAGEPRRDDIIRRWMEAAETLRSLATRAGCQRRTTGRYDFGAPGRGEMSEKAVAAFNRLTVLAERIGWERLGPLLDLVLYDTLPLGLQRPVRPEMPQEGEPEFPALLRTAKRNPMLVIAMERAIRARQEAYPKRLAAWEKACRDLQQLLERLAQEFGLRLPAEPH